MITRFLQRRLERLRNATPTRAAARPATPPGAVAYDRQLQRWLTNHELEQRQYALAASHWQGPT